MKTKLLLLALCGLLCAGSCRKKKEYPVYKLHSEEILAYTLFPTGSWWVYEEKKSKARDSLYVTDYARVIGEGDDKDPNRYETAHTRYESKGGWFNIIVQPFGDGDAARHCCNASYTVLVLPAEIAAGLDFEGDFAMEGPIDTVRVRGIEFHHVYKAIHRKKYSAGTNRFEEYFAPNVGMIRRIDHDSIEWELVKYHINK